MTRTGHTPSRASAAIVVGYVRVSTDEQGDSGLGMAAQRAAIETEVTRRGHVLLHIYEDVASGRSTDKRPGLAACIKSLEKGESGTLMVSKLDRLSRSLLDTATILQQAKTGGWAFVALDVSVDSATPSGQLVSNIMASFAEWERQVIGQRTRDALNAKRAEGVKLGRPTTMDPGAVALIRTLRRAHQSYQAIADVLNESGTPTAQGGKAWHASTVRAAYLAA